MGYLVSGIFITRRLVNYDHATVLRVFRVGNARYEWPRFIGDVVSVSTISLRIRIQAACGCKMRETIDIRAGVVLVLRYP